MGGADRTGRACVGVGSSSITISTRWIAYLQYLLPLRPGRVCVVQELRKIELERQEREEKKPKYYKEKNGTRW